MQQELTNSQCIHGTYTLHAVQREKECNKKPKHAPQSIVIQQGDQSPGTVNTPTFP